MTRRKLDHRVISTRGLYVRVLEASAAVPKAPGETAVRISLTALDLVGRPNNSSSSRKTQMSRITICTAVGDNRPFLTKLWRSPTEKPKPEVYTDEKGKERTRFPTWCTFEVVELSGIGGLCNVLSNIADDPYKCVVPGAPVRGLDLTQPHKRRSKYNAKTGEPATLEEVPNDWLSIDIDKALKSIGYSADASFQELLPPELRNTSFVLQYSSSMAHPTTVIAEMDLTSGRPAYFIKAHLWFMLKQPMLPSQAKAWLEDWCAKSGLPFDGSVYQPQSVIFTANPILALSSGS
jgi:hypothetical protein